MKILVTGASGFLGKFLCDALDALRHEVVKINSKNCDLTSEQSLLQFASVKFDRIYHLAAWTQAGDFCLRHPGEQWLINQKINTNMLAFWLEYQSQAKIICMGTSCSYDPNLPLVEENYLEGRPIDSLFTYAMTKRMLLCGLMALHKQYGLDYLYLVPSTLFGPNYHADGRQMHFIFDLIRKIMEGHFFQKPVVLWGDGYQKRELVYIEDFIRTMLFLSDKVSCEVVNIGSGEEFSIRDFAGMICHEVGYPKEQIQYDVGRYVGATSKILDIAKLKRLYPALSGSELQEGLKETIGWFYENQSQVLKG